MNKRKNISILVTCLLMNCTFFCQALANKNNNSQKDFNLEIYLPREITIKDSHLSLGQVSIIRGGESLVAKASRIALGQISVPGQRIVIDRPTVLSRLASNGIPKSKVILKGAEKVTVKQQQQTISSDEFVTLANNFLERNPASASACQWYAIRKPKDFVIPGATKDIRFAPRLVSSTKNQAKVEVAVLSGDKKIGVREVSFGPKYDSRTAVTLVDIPAGTIISPNNVKIEKVQSNYPEPADWKPPYGLVAKRQIPAKTVLGPQMVGPAKPQIIVKRNQNVVIRIERPGFLITAVGKALQDGRAGDYIKIRNVDSQRIIIASVNENGTVEPVY